MNKPILVLLGRAGCQLCEEFRGFFVIAARGSGHSFAVKIALRFCRCLPRRVAGDLQIEAKVAAAGTALVDLDGDAIDAVLREQRRRDDG